MADVILIVLYVLLVIALGRYEGNPPAAKRQGGKMRAVRKLFSRTS